MAPMTPSSHRFVTGQRRESSPMKESKRPSALRKQLVKQPQATAAQFLEASAAQFATTPRFSASRPKPLAGNSRPRSPAKPAFVHALRAIERRREDVEETPSTIGGNEDEEMLDSEPADAFPTTKDNKIAQHGFQHDLPLSPKRRRLGDPGSEDYNASRISPPAKSPFRQAKTPTSELRSHAQRFAQPTSSCASGISETTFATARPPFLRAFAPHERNDEPLPEAFSPHRRGQKFVSGGMAATVQQWVIETGQVALQSRRGVAYMRGDEFVLKVEVRALSGNGPYFVKAVSAVCEEMNVMLTQGVDGAAIRQGCILGVRAPMWEIELEGRLWKVAVDWKLLS